MEQQIEIDDRGKRSESLGKTIRKAVNRETPSSRPEPWLLMNPPFTVSNQNPNNALMKDSEPYDKDKAHKQWGKLYKSIIDCGAFVYLLPSTYKLQDLPYVANLGAYLPHLKPDTILVANFKSPPRKGEDKIGIKLFESMGYAVHQPKTTWEGEADLKWVKDNIYVGGYGIRTDVKSFTWMENKFEMDILKIKMDDPKLYHFDCMFFPISGDKALVATSAINKAGLKKLEKIVDIVAVLREHQYDGWTNCIKLENKIIHNTAPNEKSEKAFNALIEKLGCEPISVKLGEFDKSGADLSCLICHLNFNGRK